MLVKTFVEPRIRKCISSYHCKTAVFCCTENTEPGFWRDDNLLQCVKQCLVILHTWITNCFCPQFIIAEENLFAGKVTAQNRGVLQSIISDLIKTCSYTIMNIRIDEIGQKLQARLTSPPSVVPVRDSPATVNAIGLLEYNKHSFTYMWTIRNVLEKQTDTITTICSVQQTICMLKGDIRQKQKDKQERQTIQTYLAFLTGWLGSLMASASLSRKMEVPSKAIKMLCIAAQSDAASLLKLASVFYCNGKLCTVEKLLQNLEDHFSRNEILPLCRCYTAPCKLPQEVCEMVYLLRGKTARAKLFAHCVIFSLQEKHCVPPALQCEFCRAVGDDIQHRDPAEDDWMALAATDCLPYLYYLQYITYRQLGKHALQQRSLANLERCVREGKACGHVETAWNFLGQCMELEQKPEVAVTCYKTSLEIRPRNNAANWHVQNLYKNKNKKPVHTDKKKHCVQKCVLK